MRIDAMKQIIARLVTLALLLGAAGQAKADPVTWTGQIWQSGQNQNFGGDAAPTAGANNVTKAAYDPVASAAGSLGASDATFTTTSLNYNVQNMANYTPLGFLGTSTTFTNTSAQWNTGTQNNSTFFGATADLNNTYILLTANVFLTHGETFMFQHDDGVSLNINGIDQPMTNTGTPNSDPSTSPTTQATDIYTWNGATGNQTVVIGYGAVNGDPSVLIVTDTTFGTFTPAVVPEPASVAMMAIGLVAVGGYKIRRRKNAVA
jgi:PEP-CTERM motif